jgi:hypothetical protein
MKLAEPIGTECEEGFCRYAQALDAKQAEIERLQEINARLVVLHRMTMPEQAAEIERLQEALHWTASYCLDDACARHAMQVLTHDPAVGPAPGSPDTGCIDPDAPHEPVQQRHTHIGQREDCPICSGEQAPPERKVPSPWPSR